MAQQTVAVSQLQLLGGATLALDPPADGASAFVDLRRRVAACLGVGLAQVAFVAGERRLTGDGSVADALAGCSTEGVRVVVLPPHEEQVATARGFVGLVRLEAVEFPEPRDICVNMMPFIMGDQGSIPGELRHYWPIIEACQLPVEEIGKVGFLTIQESCVAEGHSQRRPGLHLECPGVVMREGRVIQARSAWGEGYHGTTTPFEHGRNYRFEHVPDRRFNCLDYAGVHAWDFLKGGIYTASSIADSCRAWNMRIQEPENHVGCLGDIEHLRDFLGEGSLLEASTLYWMTDQTPHESIPCAKSVYRQYFRLVTSSVSVWYDQHSTKNPLGIVPDPEVTVILTHDKFVDIASCKDRLGGAVARDEEWHLLVGACYEGELFRYRLQKAGLATGTDASEALRRVLDLCGEDVEDLDGLAARHDRRGKMELLSNKLRARLAKVREEDGLAEDESDEEEHAVEQHVAKLREDFRRDGTLDALLLQRLAMGDTDVCLALERGSTEVTPVTSSTSSSAGGDAGDERA